MASSALRGSRTRSHALRAPDSAAAEARARACACRALFAPPLTAASPRAPRPLPGGARAAASPCTRGGKQHHDDDGTERPSHEEYAPGAKVRHSRALAHWERAKTHALKEAANSVETVVSEQVSAVPRSRSLACCASRICGRRRCVGLTPREWAAYRRRWALGCSWSSRRCSSRTRSSAQPRIAASRPRIRLSGGCACLCVQTQGGDGAWHDVHRRDGQGDRDAA